MAITRMRHPCLNSVRSIAADGAATVWAEIMVGCASIAMTISREHDNSCLILDQQQAAAQRSAPRRHHRGVMGRDLSFFAAPPKLKTRFVNVAQTVRTATGELPAVRVEGQLAIARDA